METKDHYYLSKHLAKQAGLRRLNKILFIWGNLIPDINPFSYISSTSDNRFSGHSYSCRKAFMAEVLKKRCTGTPIWWYRTGKMFHYLADSFTRPHNEEFQYSLKHHIDYEHQLHETLSIHLKEKCHFSLSAKSADADFSYGQLEAEHLTYMKESKGLAEDCSYIMRTTTAALQTMAAAFAQSKGDCQPICRQGMHGQAKGAAV